MIIFDGLVPITTIFKGKLKEKINKKDIMIKFDYPISTPVIMKFKSKDGFDLVKIINCIIEGYYKIYKDGDKYGIWGHSIDDLSIEEIRYCKDKNLITMCVGS
jgi:hypothetical protein